MSIDYYKFNNGRQFIFTANEGNGKGFDESRVKNLVLDEDTFGDENYTKYLQSNELLGRLKVSNLIGDSNISGFFNELYMFSSPMKYLLIIIINQLIFHYIFHQIMILNELLLKKCQ